MNVGTADMKQTSEVADRAEAGLRAVAVFEIANGVLVLAAASGLLTLLHNDAVDEVAHLADRLHFHSEGHVSQILLRAASNLTDAKLWAIAAAAVTYSIVRFVEGYGLWRRRTWAEWFALLSGAMYLPWELYEILTHFTSTTLIVFVCNFAIVIYMLYVRLHVWRAGKSAE
jgi:uncharacterized membrane protein (DUF2068 family)